jgi:hypothetical protein
METRVRFVTTSEEWNESYVRFDGSSVDAFIPDPQVPDVEWELVRECTLVGSSASERRLFWTWKIVEEVPDSP